MQNQIERLAPDILDLYSNDFIRAWNAAIANLALRPLLADRPKYLALARRLGADFADQADVRIRSATRPR